MRGRPVAGHDLIHPAPIQERAQRACLLVGEGVELIVDVGPIELAIRPCDEAVERYLHPIDDPAHVCLPFASAKRRPRASRALRRIPSAFGPIPWSFSSSFSVTVVSCSSRVYPSTVSARVAGLPIPAGKAVSGPWL